MSIGGNDSGQHHAQPDPLVPLGPFFAEANARLGLTAHFETFMRTRRPHTRCQLSVLGRTTTLTSASTGTGTADPDAEKRCWKRLRAAIRAAADGNTAAAGAMLPAEIAAAEWDDNGHRIRIRRPGATTRAVRCARRGLKAMTPVPVLTALSQQLAGGATAAGILLAPIPLPSGHEPPPISMPYVSGRPLTGDIYRPAPGSIAGNHPTTPAVGPGAPLFPAIIPRSTLFPAAGDSSERDTAPTPTPVYTPPPSSQRTAPSPAPTRTPISVPTVDPTPSPSPSTTDLLDAPSPSPTTTDTPTSTPTPKLTVSPSPTITRTARHRHHKHLLRRIHRLG